jgi:hypothetical protein
MKRWLLAPALLSIACADLERITLDGRCGNRIVEPMAGEDCDGSAPPGLLCGVADDDEETAGACRFVCAEGGCPAGFVCGADDVCRVPRGSFRSMSLGFDDRPHNAIAADLDADELSDLILLSAREVQVYFGDRSGGFDEVRSYEIDSPFNQLETGDFDGDGFQDIVIEQIAGPIFLRGRKDRVLEQVARPAFARTADGQSSILAPQVRAISVAIEAFTGLRRAMLLQKRGDEVTIELPFDFTLEVRGALELGPGALPFGIAVGDAATSTGSRAVDEIALGLEQSRSITLFNLVCGGPTGPGEDPSCGPVVLAEVETLAPILGGVFFGDVDGGGALDLIIHGEEGFEVSFGDGEGGFCGDPECASGRRSKSSPLRLVTETYEQVAIPTLVAEIGFGPLVDFVFSEGVEAPGRSISAGLMLIPSAGGFDLLLLENRVSSSIDAWIQVETADINRDGLLDLVAVRPEEPTLDVLLGTGSVLYNQFSVQLSSAVSRIAVADFDGDFHDDIVAYERKGDLSLIRGTPQGPGEPSFVIQSQPVLDLVPADSLSLAGIDLVSDLMVISDATDETDGADPTYAVTLLVGSSRGQMLAPLSFVVDGRAQHQLVVETVVGSFSADQYSDIVIATSTGAVEGAVARIELWVVPGAADNAGVPIPVQVECGLHPLCFKAKIPSVANFDSDPEQEAMLVSRCPTDDSLWIIDIDAATAIGTCWQLQSLQQQIELPADLVPIDVDYDGRAEIAIYELETTKLARSTDGVEWQVQTISFPESEPPRHLTPLGDGSAGPSLAFVGGSNVFVGTLEGGVLSGAVKALYPFAVGFKEPAAPDFQEPSAISLEDRSGLLPIDLRGDSIPDLVLFGSELLIQDECTPDDLACARPEVPR